MDETWRIGLTDAARQLIREIPTDKLGYAKPAWIYKSLESMGFDRNPTMRTTVCKLLMKAKEAQKKQAGKPTTISDRAIAAPAESDETALKVRRLIQEAFRVAGGKCAVLRAEIDLIEETAALIESTKADG